MFTRDGESVLLAVNVVHQINLWLHLQNPVEAPIAYLSLKK
jgi:hypothetical protein